MYKVINYQWGFSSCNPFDLDFQQFDSPADYPVLDLHQSLHLILVLAGELEGKIDSISFSAGEGRLLLTAPWELHGNNHVRNHLTLLSITVDPNMLLGNLIAFQEKAWTLFTLPSNERQRMLDIPPIHSLVLQWGDQFQRPLAGHPQLVKQKQWLAIQSFFAEVLGVLESRLPDTPGEHYERLLPALQLLSQQSAVTLAQAAQACSLSVSRFSHLFQQTCHTSFAAYEMRTRLNRAALALRQGQMVKAVAAQEGFYDASHFAKHFAKQFGMRPKAWSSSSTSANTENQ